MALAAGHDRTDRRRVKVYELKSNDWFDRGTGFCTGETVNEEHRIHVQSEDDPDRTLLTTKISKDDGYQKQQDTLIVWTEANVTDMALSFQEPEGCAAIWEFVSEAQQRLGGPAGTVDDNLSDDIIDPAQNFVMPVPELGNLMEIENAMRMANSSAAGRDALAKFTVANDFAFFSKLVPLVEMAEDLESLGDLHRLCNIMKTLILLNDTAIIEYAVSDGVVLGVVGALEYDPDFPSHKANHRQYLSDESRFKEVVKIEEPKVRNQIHFTYRLQYLKDVVLARILDDPTFSVLNSLIFFNQVDIVQHVQGNPSFLKELFSIFTQSETDTQRKKDAVLFIQQCCSIAKGLQANARQQLYQNFIASGLFAVITFALKHPDASVRVAGTDVLVALIDHDALMMRGQIFKAISDQAKPLTDTLIELLLVERDLGVKAQMADAIKILLDPNANIGSVEAIGRSNSEFLAKVRQNTNTRTQSDNFVQVFYDTSAMKLFKPLRDLELRESVQNLTLQEVSLYSHLVEVLMFFVRQHSWRSKHFLNEGRLAARVAQLLACPQKHLKLTALKYFRTCIGLHEVFHSQQIMKDNLFGPILDIVFETMPRDNLLNSACLELFEFIKRENMKDLTFHIVENYREKLEKITYVDTFKQLVDKYEKYTAPPPENISFTSVETETPVRHVVVNGSRQFQGLKDMDAEEDAYFNGSDNEDDDAHFGSVLKPITNGASPLKAPLVDYPEDDDENMDLLAQEISPDHPRETIESPTPVQEQPQPSPSPPSGLSEKRRREEDDEDELAKLTTTPKRRSSSISSATSSVSTHSQTLRRKKSINSGKDGPPKKISIALAVKSGNASADAN